MERNPGNGEMRQGRATGLTQKSSSRSRWRGEKKYGCMYVTRRDETQEAHQKVKTPINGGSIHHSPPKREPWEQRGREVDKKDRTRPSKLTFIQCDLYDCDRWVVWMVCGACIPRGFHSHPTLRRLFRLVYPVGHPPSSLNSIPHL